MIITKLGNNKIFDVPGSTLTTLHILSHLSLCNHHEEQGNIIINQEGRKRPNISMVK